TLLYESEEKLEWAEDSLQKNSFADSIYHSYSVFVNAAKALLLTRDVSPTTQQGIINEFENHFKNEQSFIFQSDYKDTVLLINQNEPSKEFAEKYFDFAKNFLSSAKSWRENFIREKKLVIV
ncbi:MAG: HEPN domain-containing protein, partial [Ignavibacteria bacterium]